MSDNQETTIGGVGLWIDLNRKLVVCPEWASNGTTITRDEAAALWPLIKRFAETGRLTEDDAYKAGKPAEVKP